MPKEILYLTIYLKMINEIVVWDIFLKELVNY